MTALVYSARVPIARRQLLSRRGRAFAGVVGIALALLLVLALKAIFAGLESRMTAYIDGSGTDVIVAQEGIASMHMTESALPASAVAAVARVPGVAEAIGILYKSGYVEAADKSGIVAVVGGGPVPNLVAGRGPGANEIVIDRVLAERLEVGIGDAVRVLGARLRVAGEVEGTAAINGSYSFVTRATLARLLGGRGGLSYVFVRSSEGVGAGALAQRIEARVPRVTASTRERFAASERNLVGQMSTNIVRGMILVGFVIGVAVAGLVAYSTTLAQLRDYGVLRALGLRARAAIAFVLAQLGAMVAAGFLLALALVELLAVLLPRLSPSLVLTVRSGDVVEAALVAAAVAVGAGLVPLARVVRVDPASVFRRAS